jgi:hypothetical protein
MHIYVIVTASDDGFQGVSRCTFELVPSKDVQQACAEPLLQTCELENNSIAPRITTLYATCALLLSIVIG